MSAFTETTPTDRIAGVDEAGRGPLAGPVVVAAVMLTGHDRISGLDDSKRLARDLREQLFELISERCVCSAVEVIETEEIERINILAATLKGMQQAVARLDPRPALVLIDGNRAPRMNHDVRTIVGGDRWVPSISAASILAKVVRDRIMDDWHRVYPQYGFNRHKGYATPEHLRKLREYGPCPIHRRTFAPVRAILEPGLF